jgi:acetolactate synthase-1/2/3 large subunit
MLLHVAIAREDNVWPIVKPGASNRDMIDQPRRTTNASKEQVA